MAGYEGNFGGYEGYENNDYGGFGGGGFDPMGGGFLQDGGDSGKKGEKKGKNNETIFPLSVKQIEKALPADNGYVIYDAPVSTVKIMGFIEQYEEHSTNRTYVINDGTGSIQCVLYNNDNMISYPLFSYVKVYGTIRSLEGSTKLMLFHIDELKNLDEMTYHLLDCIHNFCKMTKQDKNATVFRGLSTPQGNLGRQSITNTTVSNGAKDAILQAITSVGGSEEGISIDAIARMLHNKYPRDEIRRQCTDLCDEGSIYSTIDEDHFLASV